MTNIYKKHFKMYPIDFAHSYEKKQNIVTTITPKNATHGKENHGHDNSKECTPMLI